MPPAQRSSRSNWARSGSNCYATSRPKITSVGLLVNPNNPNAVPQIKQMEEVTKTLGLPLDTLEASAESDFDSVFRTLRQRNDALVVSADPFFINHRSQLVGLAAQYAIPTMYYERGFVSVGGLVSYASNLDDS